MLFGVLGFGYDTFPQFETMLARDGFFTVNLGDNAQTLAARRLLERCGVPADRIVRIDRDTLPTYDGPPVRLLMNGVFREPGFPIPPQVEPLFLGFTAGGPAMAQNLDYLRRYAPIGCRDTATAEELAGLGVKTDVSGCVTLSLPRRQAVPTAPRVLIVSGSGVGALPDGLLDHMPPDLLAAAEFVHHRLPVGTWPLSERDQDWIERYEAHLLDQYRDRATLVVTPLHHVAAPCLAMGVPVVLARQDDDPRFTFIKTLTPVYTPDAFDRIDWRPAPVDTSAVRDRFERAVRRLLSQSDGSSGSAGGPNPSSASGSLLAS